MQRNSEILEGLGVVEVPYGDWSAIAGCVIAPICGTRNNVTLPHYSSAHDKSTLSNRRARIDALVRCYRRSICSQHIIRVIYVSDRHSVFLVS
jgi:hypothetical protein